MAQRIPFDINFPLGGLNQRYAYQQQPPYTTPGATNVRSFDNVDGRTRGGSRPGFGKDYLLDSDTVLGTGKPIRLLEQLAYEQSSIWEQWVDTFTNGVSSLWTGSTMPWIAGYLDYVWTDYDTGAVYSYLDKIYEKVDTSKIYSAKIFIVPFEDEHYGDYTIYVGLDDTTPIITTDSVAFKLTLTGTAGAWTGTVVQYNASSKVLNTTMTGGTAGQVESGWFEVTISGTTAKAYWRGTEIYSGTITAIGAAERRVGYSIDATVEGGICLIDQFVHGYYRVGAGVQVQNKLIATSNAVLYREAEEGVMEIAASTSDADLVSDRRLHGVDFYQKLYIADRDEPRMYNGAQEGVLTKPAAVTRLTDPTNTPVWTAYNIDKDNDVVVVFDLTGAGSAVAGTYKISAVAAGYVDLEDDYDVIANCSYKIVRAPKIYDGVADTLEIWQTTDDSGFKGQVPTECDLVANYVGRVWLAGGRVWYASRVEDPLDFDYAEDDTEAAIAGISGNVGEIGDYITALIPFSDDFMIIGGRNSINIMRGDIKAGGIIDNISRQIGIIKGGWCWLPDGHLLFLTIDGLYMLSPGSMQFPKPVSEEKIPHQLQNIDYENMNVEMGYSPVQKGVWITIADEQEDGSGRTSFWFDIKNGAFWKDELPSDFYPLSMTMFNSELNTKRDIVFGCRDGYIRRSGRAYYDDDGDVIESEVEIGALALRTRGNNTGSLESITVNMAYGSGQINVGLYTALSAQALEYADEFMNFDTQSANNGVGYPHRPHMGGKYARIKLSNAERIPWAIEGIEAVKQSNLMD